MSGSSRDSDKSSESHPGFSNSAKAYQVFEHRHGEMLRQWSDALFCIPRELQKALHLEVPKWLREPEWVFERDLAQLCESHGAMGIWNGRLIPQMPSFRPTLPISKELYRDCGWSEGAAYSEFTKSLDDALQLGNALQERSRAYAGWLITNPDFLTERDFLRKSWEYAVMAFGALPVEPLPKTADETGFRIVADSADVTYEFLSDFSRFYQRWMIRQLVAWDLPEPLGFNIGGPATLANLMGTSTVPVVQSPMTIRIPMRDARRSASTLEQIQSSEHLRDWQLVQDEKHPSRLNYAAFQRILQMHLYRDLAIGRRYGDRFAGVVLRLDRAFAEFFGTSDDVVRRLRRHVNRQPKQE